MTVVVLVVAVLLVIVLPSFAAVWSIFLSAALIACWLLTFVESDFLGSVVTDVEAPAGVRLTASVDVPLEM